MISIHLDKMKQRYHKETRKLFFLFYLKLNFETKFNDLKIHSYRNLVTVRYI